MKVLPILLLAALGLNVEAFASTELTAAEKVSRSFLTAIYQNDKGQATKFVLSSIDLEHFIGKKTLSTEEKARVQSQIGELKIELTDNYRILLEKGEQTEYPVGCHLRFSCAYRGRPMVISTFKTAQGWKVDLRWWSKMRAIANGQKVSRKAPENIARSYLIALMERDTRKLKKYLPEGIDPEHLFPEGYKAPFEDQYYYLAAEMPIVELAKDEKLLNETGVFEPVIPPGSDQLYLLGIYWDTELPFLFVKEGRSFKVRPGDHLFRIGLSREH